MMNEEFIEMTDEELVINSKQHKVAKRNARNYTMLEYNIEESEEEE